jgi:hypothetical protein
MILSIVSLLLSPIAPEADLEEAQGFSSIYVFVRLLQEVLASSMPERLGCFD